MPRKQPTKTMPVQPAKGAKPLPAEGTEGKKRTPQSAGSAFVVRRAVGGPGGGGGPCQPDVCYPMTMEP